MSGAAVEPVCSDAGRVVAHAGVTGAGFRKTATLGWPFRLVEVADLDEERGELHICRDERRHASVWREVFPLALAPLEGAGALTVTVTDTEITVSSAQPSATAMYRLQRKSSLH